MRMLCLKTYCGLLRSLCLSLSHSLHLLLSLIGGSALIGRRERGSGFALRDPASFKNCDCWIGREGQRENCCVYLCCGVFADVFHLSVNSEFLLNIETHLDHLAKERLSENFFLFSLIN